MNKLIIYPKKSRFEKKSAIEFIVLAKDYPQSVEIKVFHLGEEIFNDFFKIESEKQIISLPQFPENKSYGVMCIHNEGIEKTAFETYENWEMCPRYGFLSDFSSNDLDKDDFIETLLRLHINVVQYYDWMYQHNDLIAPTSEFTDLMGRKLNQDVVRNKIAICKNANIANIAYGAIYGASNAFYEKHKEWAFFNSQKQPIKFIDVFTIMNFTKASPWRNHIINEYKKAIEIMSFDGIHMDTYGYPKIAKDYLNNTVYLDDHFAGLISDTKKALEKDKLSSKLIFNNVGGWPVEKTYYTNQSALYIEIWDPISTYEDIATLVRKVKSLTKEKELIISAYLKPYYQKDKSKAVIAHKFLNAVLSSLGAHHLIMGEDKKALRTGYYCDYGSLNEKEFEEIRNYYDFNAEFSEILYDKTLEDVSFTHAFHDNIEYRLLNDKCDIHAKEGKVYTILKENKEFQVIHLLNLSSMKDGLWNEAKDLPESIENIEIKLLVIDDVEEIMLFSPDHAAMRIEYTKEFIDRGIEIKFVVPKLLYWDMIYIKKSVSDIYET